MDHVDHQPMSQMSSSTSSSSSSAAYSSSAAVSAKLHRASLGCCRTLDDQCLMVQQHQQQQRRRSSAAVETFSQVLKAPGIPEGQAAPDFEEKLRPITAQEGDRAVLRAKVTGVPVPSVRWERASGRGLSEETRTFYDDIAKQHILKIKSVNMEDDDVYKCVASNEHGDAVYSVSIVVTENPALDFKKMLKKGTVERREERKRPPTEEEMLRILSGANRKDYEKLCAEHGFTDFRGILRKLKEMRKKVDVEMVHVLKPLENIRGKVGSNAVFDTILELKDPNIKMHWFQGAELLRVQFSRGKYEVKQMGTKHALCISGLLLSDAGVYSLHVGDKTLTARLTVVDEPLSFLSDFQPIRVTERQTAVLEVHLSKKSETPPVWTVRGKEVKRDERFEVSVSEDGLTYTLKIKDVKASDAGDYDISLGDLRATVPLFIDRIPIRFSSQLKNVRATERSDAHLECELSRKEVDVRWLKDGRDITGDPRYIFMREGKRAEVIVEDCRPDDEGEFSIVCTQDHDDNTYVSSARLTVQERFAAVKSDMSDVQCPTGAPAELCVALDDEKVDGRWFKDGVEISELHGVQVVKQGAVHKLVFSRVSDGHQGKYTFRAKGAESEAVLTIADPPEIDSSVLDQLSAQPVTVNAGQTATIRIPFRGRPPPKLTWYRDGLEVVEDDRIKVEHTADSTSLVISRCVREDSGAIMLRLKSSCGTAVANLHLNVLDRPKPPQGKAEFLERSRRCIKMKWRAPRDNGGRQVTSFVIERRLAEGKAKTSRRQAWAKVGEVDSSSTVFSDLAVQEGQAYQYRIRAVNALGVSDALETNEVSAGEPIEPPGASSQPQVSQVTADSMTVSWNPPPQDGGAPLLGYTLERRKKGSSIWIKVNNDLITGGSCVVEGLVSDVEYEFRVTGVNRAGPGSPSSVSNPVLAKDPIRAPGVVTDFSVFDSSSSTISLRWRPPEDGDQPSGYILEQRSENAREWTKASKLPVSATSFTATGLQERLRYFFRVRGVNEGGVGDPVELEKGALAMPPAVAPRFDLQGKLKSQMVIRAGTALCLHLSFTGSPPPGITWLKDGVPADGRECITKSKTHSQFFIPSTQRSDSATYRALLRNEYGEAHYDVMVRITDFPRPPTNLGLVVEVAGTVTLQWDHTPDLADDEGAHYVIMKRDTSTACWFTVAECVFNNSFTVTGLLPGRRYYFRVVAQNSVGASDPLDSTDLLVVARETEYRSISSVLSRQEQATPPRQAPPTFLVPLKNHTARRTYDCTMSCAYQGTPTPQACWYKGGVRLSNGPRFWQSTADGVCTLGIPSCGGQDSGEYTLMLENPLGTAECSCHLLVYDKDDRGLLESLNDRRNKEKFIL